MEYSYKLLDSSEVGRLKELIRLFGDVFDEPTTYHDAVPSDAYLQSLLDREQFVVVVAVGGQEVVGGLVAYVLEKFEQARKEIYIYDLAVLENHRRKGIATGLINALKDLAKQRAAYVIFVQADKGDEPAVKLYESLGVKEDVYHFDIDPAK